MFDKYQAPKIAVRTNKFEGLFFVGFYKNKWGDILEKIFISNTTIENRIE